MTRFNLPVMGGTGVVGVGDLVRLSLRAEGVFDGTLGERVGLECGVAVVSEEFPDLGAANQVRDLTLAGRTMAEALTEVEGVFGGRGLRCRSWIGEQAVVPAEAVGVLEEKGYRLRRDRLWVLRESRELTGAAGVTVIPGRASFGGVAALAAAGYGGSDLAVEAQHRTAAVRRLDDTQVDCLVALEGTEPVGMLYFTTNSQLGLITQFSVRAEWRRRGVGSLLMGRAIELAARSRVRHVTLFCEEGNWAAEALYEKAGFVAAGTVDSMAIGG